MSILPEIRAEPRQAADTSDPEAQRSNAAVLPELDFVTGFRNSPAYSAGSRRNSRRRRLLQEPPSQTAGRSWKRSRLAPGRNPQTARRSATRAYRQALPHLAQLSQHG